MGTALLRGLALLAAPTLAAGSLGDPEVCFVLDAVLFLYGLVLTGLYCRLRLEARRWRAAADRGKEEAVYADLSSGHQDAYEALQMKPSSPSSPSSPLLTPPDPPVTPRDPPVTPPDPPVTLPVSPPLSPTPGTPPREFSP